MIENETKKVEGIVEEISEPFRISDNPKAPFTIELVIEGKKFRAEPGWDADDLKKIVEGIEVMDNVRLLMDKNEKGFWNIVASEIIEKQVKKAPEQKTLPAAIPIAIPNAKEFVKQCYIEARELAAEMLTEMKFEYTNLDQLADQIRRTRLAFMASKR